MKGRNQIFGILMLSFFASFNLTAQNQATSSHFKLMFKKEKNEINNTIDSKEKVYLVAKNISKNITDQEVGKKMTAFFVEINNPDSKVSSLKEKLILFLEYDYFDNKNKLLLNLSS